jgi:hypothetical protein
MADRPARLFNANEFKHVEIVDDYPSGTLACCSIPLVSPLLPFHSGSTCPDVYSTYLSCLMLGATCSEVCKVLVPLQLEL